ncbi:SCO7613 C-terminal domain-containing membrane protein [Agromyces sp. Marseille-Q5079]|uniref:SCO7613 C-terminal domain-containing membrane protein n=1 Tax=Agromyces sp. Marseille-Q5079 TaxID=3439059 RepID=UPI003D9C7FD3
MSDHPAAASAMLPRWPADPAQFVDTTRCPSCLSPLASAVCSACGLDLAGPDAAEVLASGRRIHAEGARRADLIRRMYEAQAAAAPAPTPPPIAPAVPSAPAGAAEPKAGGDPAPAPTSAPAEPVLGAVPAPSPAPAPVTATADSAPVAPAPAVATGPRRSGVQVLLLTLGVVLISVAAIVFLFVAYLVASIEVRSVIIAVASVLVLGLAWLLRTRRLPGTAEGVASVAVVLLLLDVWIVRANALFGSDLVDGSTYTGWALLVVAALLAGTRAVSGIRAPGLAAAGLLPTGVLLLGIGAAADPGTGFWAGGLAVSVLGSLAALAPRTAERAVVLVAGYGGGALALLAAPWALPALPWSQAWAFLGGAAVWALAWFVWRRVHQVWADSAAAVAGFALALAPAVSAFAELAPEVSVWAAPAATGVVACLLAAIVGRRAPQRRGALWALVAALVVAAVTTGHGIVIGIDAIRVRLSASAPAWSDADTSSSITTMQAGAAAVPLIVALGATAVLLLLGRLGRLSAVPIGALGAGVLFIGAMVPSPFGSAVTMLALTAGSLLAAAFIRVPGVQDASLRVVLVVIGVSGGAIGWIVGFAATSIWPWVSLVVLVTVFGGRLLAGRIWSPTTSEAIGLVHTTTLGVLAATTLGALVPWLDAAGAAFEQPASAAWICLGSAAAILIALTALVPLGSMGDRVAFTVPMLLAATLAVGALLLTPTEGGPTWAPAAGLAVAGGLWLRPSAPQALRVAVAALVPLAIAAAAGSIAFLLLDAEASGYVLAGVVLASAGLAHLLARPRPDAATAAWVAAVVALGMLALATTVFVPGESWLVLAILAPVPILLCSVAGDPIGGDAPTRHLSWLSAGLAILSLYAWLAGDGVTAVEAYTLPLAAVLAACGALISWRRAPSTPSGVSRGRTALFASAAAIAVLPSVGSTAASDPRALILVAGGAVFMLAAMFLPESSRGVPWRLLIALTGWSAASIAAVVRGTSVALGSESPLPIEFWPVLGLVAGLALSVGWARSSSRPPVVAEWLAAASVVLAAIPTLTAIVSGESATLRTGVLLTLLGAAAIVGTALRARPASGPVFTWTMRGLLVLSGLVALASKNVEPFDVVTVPIGIALIATGAIAMTRSATGSWRALGIGLAVLLIPPFWADFSDPQLWRIVALGVAALAALVVGAQRRLQAPFVLGGTVLLVHAVVQFWPAITVLYEAVWWWLWLGLAGVVLVALAATYERQMRLARNTIRSIAAMR